MRALKSAAILKVTLPPAIKLGDPVPLPYRIAQPGRYTVTYRGSLLDVTAGPIPRAPEKFTGTPLDCPAASFELLASSPR